MIRLCKSVCCVCFFFGVCSRCYLATLLCFSFALIRRSRCSLLFLSCSIYSTEYGEKETEQMEMIWTTVSLPFHIFLFAIRYYTVRREAGWLSDWLKFSYSIQSESLLCIVRDRKILYNFLFFFLVCYFSDFEIKQNVSLVFAILLCMPSVCEPKFWML